MEKVVKNTRIPAKNKYIVFEGIDGTGKSTQIDMIRQILISKDFDVLRFKEPSDSVYGTKIRNAMKSKERLSFNQEFDLFLQDRNYNVENKIKPALKLDTIILQDRSYFSMAAYQGPMNVMDFKKILEMNEKIAIKPDILLLFFVDIDVALKRMNRDRNSLTYMEKRDNLVKVNDIYEKISDMIEYNSYSINANAKISDVTKQIINVLVKNEVIE